MTRVVPHRKKNPRRCGPCAEEGRRRDAAWIVQRESRPSLYVCVQHGEDFMVEQ